MTRWPTKQIKHTCIAKEIHENALDVQSWSELLAGTFSKSEHRSLWKEICIVNSFDQKSLLSSQHNSPWLGCGSTLLNKKHGDFKAKSSSRSTQCIRSSCSFTHYISNLRFCGRNFLHYCRWWWGLRNTLPDTRACGRSLQCCWWISCRYCWYSRHMNSDHDSDHHFLMPKQRLSPVPSCPVKHKWTYFV